MAPASSLTGADCTQPAAAAAPPSTMTAPTSFFSQGISGDQPFLIL
jgi:hypothetical protein